MDRLHTPATVHELRGQPVEELRVDGPLTLRSEVFAGFDNSPPEILLPDAVHRSARGKRVFLAHQPSREAKAVGRAILPKRRERSGNICVNFFALVQKRPADANEVV